MLITNSAVVTVKPRRGWGGNGLLGVVARYDFYFANGKGADPAYDRCVFVEVSPENNTVCQCAM